MADIVTLEFIPGVVNTQEFPINNQTHYQKLRNRLSPLGKGGIGVSSSYEAEESELQLNERLSNESTPDSSVRSWRPLSRNDNPLFYGICEIQRSH